MPRFIAAPTLCRCTKDIDCSCLRKRSIRLNSCNMASRHIQKIWHHLRALPFRLPPNRATNISGGSNLEVFKVNIFCINASAAHDILTSAYSSACTSCFLSVGCTTSAQTSIPASQYPTSGQSRELHIKSHLRERN